MLITNFYSLSIVHKKVILAILDGWGIGKPDKFNAIANAKTPNFDRLLADYPNIQLRADGEYVGLPAGQFGTSEINHQVIGSGRVILQDLPRIDTSIKDGSFATNKFFRKLFAHVQTHKSKLHLVGIVSDGKVHSSLEHTLALIKAALEYGIKNIYLHVFSDGRDVPPKSVEEYMQILDQEFAKSPEVRLATMQGRFWLDRDRDWARTKQAVDLLVEGKGNHYQTWQAVVNFHYNQNVTDEYFEQALLDKSGVISVGDAVIVTHYRSDRTYQLVKDLLDRQIKDVQIASFTELSEEFAIDVVFPRLPVTQTLSEVISQAGRKQFHITETEKYRHLTYFFNGSREEEFAREEWLLLQSTRFVKPYYNFEPSMQAFAITQEVINRIEKNEDDFIVINFPNTDMVGHTGNYEAAVIAAESVDFCLGRIYEALKAAGHKYALLVTADHGNSDVMWDYEAEQPHTQHTTNPVPFILVSDIHSKLHKRESLEDIAPTILDLMGLEKPAVMSGESLLVK